MSINDYYPQDVTDTVRIDKGPRVKSAVASTEFLMSGTVASHYRVGRPDALGQTIEQDTRFSYVDWLSPEDQHVFTVYKRDDEGRYQIVKRCDTPEEAEQLAATL